MNFGTPEWWTLKALINIFVSGPEHRALALAGFYLRLQFVREPTLFDVGETGRVLLSHLFRNHSSSSFILLFFFRRRFLGAAASESDDFDPPFL